MKLFTIGGYGHSESSFFSSLGSHQIDLFVDIRARRGMRGKKYAFLNAVMLEKKLFEINIKYLHLKSLAPTEAVRDVQRSSDAILGQAKRNRAILFSGFVFAYKKEVLQSMTPPDVLASFFGYGNICLFCVEATPTACHRSVVADWLEQQIGPARHL